MESRPVSAVTSSALTVLRACAVLFIVGYWHLFDETRAFPDYQNPFALRLTYLALGVFTFTSGYLLYPKAATASPWAFYRNRLLRLYPLFLLACVSLWAVGWQPLGTLVKGALLVSPYLPPQPLTLWYVVMLLHFYALAPVLARACSSHGAAALFVAAYVYLHLLLARLGVVYDVRLLAYFPVFVWGLWVRAHRGESSLSWRWWFAAVLSVCLAFLPAPDDISLTLAIPAMCVLPAVALHALSSRRTASVARFLAPVAYAMLPMYLFHRALYPALKQLYFPRDGTWQILYLLFVCLPVIILVSYGIQCGYDALLRRLSPSSPR